MKNDKPVKPVTIILPTYCPDHEVVEHLYRCVHALQNHTSKDLFDLIIVEQGSPECRDFSSYSLLVHAPEPLGYARAVNLGLKLATTEYVCIINNDVFVGPGWLEQMLADFQDIDRCGVLAPQEGKAIAARADDPAITLNDHWWSLILAKRQVLGLLDEVDLNYRYHDQAKNIELWSDGYAIARTSRVVVEHVNSATYNKMQVDEGPERDEMMRRYGVLEFKEWVKRKFATWPL